MGIKIKGIRIRLHYSWYIALGIITWSLSASYFPHLAPSLSVPQSWLLGFMASLCLFASVLIHELGHAAVAIKNGVEVKDITLHVFGGVSEFRTEVPSPNADLWVTASGPLTSLVLSGGFALMPGIVPAYLSQMNLMIAAFNLVPAFPLDGGRLLRAILWKTKGDYIWAADKASATGMYITLAMIIIGVLLILVKVFGTGIWLLMLGTLLRVGAGAYNKQVRGVSQSDKIVHDLMVPLDKVITARADQTIDDFLTQVFLIHGFHGYPVADADGKFVGMVSYWNLKTALLDGDIKRDMLLSKVMEPLETVNSKSRISLAMQKMLLQNKDRMLVADNGQVQGLLTKSTVIRSMGWKPLGNI